MGEVVDHRKRRLLLVDTNCFLRIYYSPLRPFLGAQIGNFEIYTLISLLDEVSGSTRLGDEYAWLNNDLICDAKTGAFSKLLNRDKKDVAREMQQLRPYANALLWKHCLQERIEVKSLSGRDIELLATAVVFDAVIASDEWPLKLVIEDLTSEDDGYHIDIVTSLHVLHLIEQAGKLTADERRETVRAWLRCGEKLPRDWRSLYQRLFSEAPPAVQ